ncbi:TonB-dependent receptor plug domain-containing protein [Undibacterium sp. Jales W-56]|uniref:TonB-dependent receptor n=1 Tax=Undibacterium sp. Jales W-56 TaxID=2897325 RepID=UPI0021D245C3|nr:TonB-dependent receptor plug domain-containing protein [Undibacterium sp. Jales W-56]MCU6435458.1 TonB-dependent receptor plug domain-containing protein [Undibacterium sp. Jales W-56]
MMVVSTACLFVFAQPVGAQSINANVDNNKNDKTDGAIATVEISSQTTRSAVSLRGSEIQKILPGINPVKSLQTLPGVTFATADPWGNNEQNLSLFVHGFNGQQLGYTMDGVPLGDQNYGNYNGLSPQRAVISENVRNVILSSGAGNLATPSTSNLGGTIEVFSSDPLAKQKTSIEQTFGSYSTSRTYARFDTGNFGEGNAAYISVMRQDARAWDFDGKQGGKQLNAKFVSNKPSGKLTFYFNYNDKIEPNEDSTVHVAGETSAPYTRPFLYPDFPAALAYLSPTGATPAADGANYRNYYSDAQRKDILTYAKYDLNINESTVWSNQAYFHRDDGVGVVAGPIGAAGLPALFSVYFPNQNLKSVFGNSGYATRTTEYDIHRSGLISNLRTEFGHHQIEFGGWWEHNQSSAYRRWYPLDVNKPSSPYDRPSNPLITQYGSEIRNNVIQLHLQDEWRVRPDMVLQAGFKSSLQYAKGDFPVQPRAGAISGGSLALPVGEIDTKKWFLPQVGMLWDLSARDQLFVNVQKNMRQFVTYGAGGASPWSLASQSAFDLFKNTAQPETSLTYEAGLRGKRNLDLGPLNKIDGQVTIYHVDFSNRLLQISPTPVISSIIGGNPILANVGSVTTDGIDLAGTLHFGRNFSFYNALSYNRSVYADDYNNGKALVATSGKKVPGSPEWMNKFVASATFGDIEMQLIGDYVGKRYATYTNDLSVDSYFMLNLGVNAKIPVAPNNFIKNARVRLNVTNLNQVKGDSVVVVGAANGTYNTFPIAPRQFFVTVGADF